MRLLLTTAIIAMPMLAAAEDDARPSLTVGVQDVRTGLNPGIETGNTGFPVTNALFDTLVRRDFMSNGEGTGTGFLPGLAESWEREDDRTLVLTLREGLTFHNGEPLTSEDVKFTLDRVLDPDSQYVRVRSQLGSIARVEAPEPLTVRIITEEPDPVLVHVLAYPGSAIVPKDYYEEVGFDGFAQRPVGSGPYRLVTFSPDERLALEAFDDYWAGRPPASTLTFREIPEVSARITALANGEVDIISTLPPDQVAAVERLDCCDVRSVFVNSHVINYNTDNPVMADPAFRRALNLAIDRELLVEALWNGEAAVPHSHQYLEWGELYNPERLQLQYDPEVARQLIEGTGYAGEEVTFITHPAYYTNGLAATEAVVEMWRDVGVNAQVMVHENWYNESNNNPDIEVRNLSDWAILADPHATILWSWTITALWEGNDAYQALGEQAAATLDVDERFALYQQMLDMFEEEAPGTVLYRVKEFYGVRRDIDWHPYTVYMMDFRADNLNFDEQS